MRTYHFPLLMLTPAFEGSVTSGRYRVSRRAWDTSIFDLATLATKHRLHLPYELMSVLLSGCNLELAVAEATSLEEAVSGFEAFRAGLYVAGVSPFVCPFVTTESINHYSGINERDSALERGKEPKIPSPFSSGSGTLEAWPLEPAFSCVRLRDQLSAWPSGSPRYPLCQASHNERGYRILPIPWQVSRSTAAPPLW